MVFTSYTYVVFLAAVFLVHWSVPSHLRKPVLIVASYLFYASWKWQFTALLLAVSLFNYAYGRLLHTRGGKTSLVFIGAAVNLLPLLYYKYSGFLLANAAAVAGAFGLNLQASIGALILPLGISFFTFQGIAYLIDVAGGDEPLTNLSDFLLFKAFWPQLIAGPIVRLHEMRPQLETLHSLEYEAVAQGADRIIRGMFKKVVLADTLAPIVDVAFTPNAGPHFLDSIAGILGFALQIYFDFSAYSDIAIGSALLFGYRFPENFNWPYAARSPQEFWNRWHITLSRWIRDYVYTPLSFSTRRRPYLMPVWLLFAMAVCGLWHGAQWTFVLWGVWHGILLIAGQTALKPLFSIPKAAGFVRTQVQSALAWAVTFTCVSAGWLLFRAASFAQAVEMLRSIVTMRGGLRPGIMRINGVLIVFVFLAGLIATQAARPLLERFGGALPSLPRLRRVAVPLAYAAIIVLTIVMDSEARAFVYFQF